MGTEKQKRLDAGGALKMAASLLGDMPAEIRTDGGRLVIRLKPADVPAAARKLRDDENLSLKYLSFVSGVDHRDHVEAVYILNSPAHPVTVELKATLDGSDPAVPTLAGVFGTAAWHEREAFDLLGIRFEGHPDLRRILNREDLDAFPLRKDAQPARKQRPEWRWEGIAPPARLPDESEGGTP